MDDEKLIQLVRQNAIIFDKKLLGFKDKIKKQIAWEQISEELDYSVEICMQRWRTLRERYAREKKRRNLPGDSKTAVLTSWEHMSSLQFLDDYITPKRSRTQMQAVNCDACTLPKFEPFNFDDNGSSVELIQLSETSPNNVPDSPRHPPSLPTPPPPAVALPKKRKSSSIALEQITESVQQAMNCFTNLIQSEHKDLDSQKFGETVENIYADLNEENRKTAKIVVLKFITELLESQYDNVM